LLAAERVKDGFAARWDVGGVTVAVDTFAVRNMQTILRPEMYTYATLGTSPNHITRRGVIPVRFPENIIDPFSRHIYVYEFEVFDGDGRRSRTGLADKPGAYAKGPDYN
jgi:hypothetical protein